MRLYAMLLSAIILIAMASSGFATAEKEGLSSEVKKLSRNTEWNKVEQLDLDFNIHHPQGMTKIDDRYYISSVEIIEKPEKYDEPKNGYDRTAGKGVGHLYIVDQNGQLIKDIKLGEGDMYHPGGIDFDGENIWVPVAEYRPDSKSIMYKVDAETHNVTKVFEVDDHIGGVVSDEKTHELQGVSWGSRKFYEWNEKGKQKSVEFNSSHFIDYQDCEGVDEGNMICTGLAGLSTEDGGTYELGGLALLDKKTKEIHHEIPIPVFSPQHHTITRNPVFLETDEDGIKLYAVPDDDHASLLIYETNNEG
ncbi:DUF6454 family protein [Pseudalkalibacillus sp. SCS-8]|uniref:DUF6454 family protein n=1 Tax=Pseudalkalibacillus nanhaiensis TaxID=3115291 RepID=UPI0032DB76A8